MLGRKTENRRHTFFFAGFGEAMSNISSTGRFVVKVFLFVHVKPDKFRQINLLFSIFLLKGAEKTSSSGEQSNLARSASSVEGF